jgi:hypothetical protein
MTQVTHFNQETLVRYLRLMMQYLQAQQHTAVIQNGGPTIVLSTALRDLNEQYPELSEKDEKFLRVIRATRPQMLSHAKELVSFDMNARIPEHLKAVNDLYIVYLSTLKHWEKI